MLWPVVLPFYVTSLLLAAAVILATIAAPKVGWKRGRVFGWGAMLGIVAFVPSCTVVMKAANAVRLGVGHYENCDAIWDRRFKRWLPNEATDITLQTHMGGYCARFKIDEPSLDAWLDQCWSNGSEWAATAREEPKVDGNFEPAKFEQRFGRLGGLELPDDTKWVQYEGPRRPNWAGATTWFDEESGVAYQDVAFW